MKAQALPEHGWFDRLIGEWRSEAIHGVPDAADQRWTESVRSIGGLWIVAEGRGELPGGGSAETRMTLGYDPRRRAYVGS